MSELLDLGIGDSDTALIESTALSVLVIRTGGPYTAREVAHACGVPLLGELPDDPRAASVWSDGAPAGRWFHRSRLQREAQLVATRLHMAAAASTGAAAR